MSAQSGLKRKPHSDWQSISDIARRPKKIGAAINPLTAPRDLKQLNAIDSQLEKLLKTGQSTLNTAENFPEFAEGEYQNVVDKVYVYKTGFLTNYNKEEKLVVDIKPPAGEYIPSTCEMEITLQVVSSDKKDIVEADLTSVNGFFFSYMNQIKVVALDGGGAPTNKSVDGIRDNCMFNYLYTTTKSYRDKVKRDMLYIDESTFPISETDDRLPASEKPVTSKNIAERVKLFNAQLLKATTYRLPLKHFDSFFTIDKGVNANITRKVQFLLERNANKLLESVKSVKLDQRDKSPYKIIIHGTPTLSYTVLQASSSYNMIYNSLLATAGHANLSQFMDIQRSITEIPTGVLRKQEKMYRWCMKI